MSMEGSLLKLDRQVLRLQEQQCHGSGEGEAK